MKRTEKLQIENDIFSDYIIADANGRATVAYIMGHTEEVNEKYYDYDVIGLTSKQRTMDTLHHHIA